jgi:hypothetical protein
MMIAALIQLRGADTSRVFSRLDMPAILTLVGAIGYTTQMRAQRL